MKTPVSLPKGYENNPFFVATTGIELLFKRAQSVGIFLAILAGISALSALPSWFGGSTPESNVQKDEKAANDFAQFVSSIPAEVWALIAVVALVIILIGLTISIVFNGVSDYTASRIARDKEATLSEAFRAVFKNFWGYTWVLAIVWIKTFLWTLLFIIPGLIMAVRYSLSGVAYFDTGKKGNAAVKESLALTKNAFLTTFSSQTLLNLITLGAIPMLLMPGINAVLYRQFSPLAEKGQLKPKAHALSWVTLLVPLFFVLLLVIGLIFLAYAAVNYMNTAP